MPVAEAEPAKGTGEEVAVLLPPLLEPDPDPELPLVGEATPEGAEPADEEVGNGAAAEEDVAEDAAEEDAAAEEDEEGAAAEEEDPAAEDELPPVPWKALMPF